MLSILLSTLLLAFYTGIFNNETVSAASIDMTVSSSISTDILPTNPNGTEGSSDTTTSNVSITTDNITGYTLSLSSSSATAPALTGDNGSISSISTEQSAISNFTSGTWGYKPTKKNGDTWDSLSVTSGSTSYTSGYFLPAPTTTGDTLDSTAAANSTANEYNLTIATKIGSETSVGSYSSAFTVIAVTNPMPSYNISYELAGGTAGASAPTTGTYESDLTISNPTKDGYNFTGWTITGMDTTEHYYGTSSSSYETSTETSLSSITATWFKNLRMSSGTVTFTANWEVACTGYMLGGTCVVYMQDITSSAKTAMASGTVYSLKDSRDNTTYAVSKLADDNVWMLDNLRLGGTSTISLTPSDTNITSNYTLPASGSWSNSYTASYINSASKDTTTTSYGSGSGKIGVYYNYCAASAGTICSSSSTSDATYDICPKGWRMPTGGDSGEYQALYTAYSSNYTNFQAALSTPLSGYYTTSMDPSVGFIGQFWSSTYYGSSSMYMLSVQEWSVQAVVGKGRKGGISLRCVADPPTIDDIEYMQDMTSAIADTMTTGTTYQLKDKRDNETYNIAKLADGNVWMLDNLRLGGTSTISLTSSDTNIASNYTLPASGTVCFLYGSCTGTSGATGTGFTVAAINSAYKDTTTTSYGSGSGKIGVYYNYCAASAGTICTSSNSSNATYDICPKGWRMPTSGSSGEYQALYTAYSSNATNFNAALSTSLSGYFDDGSAAGQGLAGVFWSSTGYNNIAGYTCFLGVSSSNVVTQGQGLIRYDGLSVRCVAQ